MSLCLFLFGFVLRVFAGRWRGQDELKIKYPCRSIECVSVSCPIIVSRPETVKLSFCCIEIINKEGTGLLSIDNFNI